MPLLASPKPAPTKIATRMLMLTANRQYACFQACAPASRWGGSLEVIMEPEALGVAKPFTGSRVGRVRTSYRYCD
jgi:hypothetical protein